MHIFELFIINVSILTFPILIYLIFDGFKNVFIEEQSESLLELLLIFDAFILMFFYHTYDINQYISCFSIPILLAFMFNKTKTSIVLSVITIVFTYEILNLNLIFIVILIMLYYIIYYIYMITDKSINYLINSITVINLISIIVYYGLFIGYKNSILMIICLYILIVYSIAFLIEKSRKSIKTYETLKEMEDDKLLKTSIFKVTHEIKNPLAVMKGYLSMFDSNDKDKCERYKNILIKEVDNALLVLKDFSEINHLSIDKKDMDFNELLFEIKETIVPFFNDKSVHYIFKSEKNIRIFADYNRLKQVLINILKNSTEALKENGKIIVNTFTSERKLIIIIKDNGIGMDKDTLNNLFTPFYSKKSYGSGLGLCLSKEIVEAHNGTINYKSIINKHTTVTIELPL